MVLRQGLINGEFHSDVENITKLFKDLNIELENEKQLHWSKIRLVQKQWDLIKKETEGDPNQKGEIIKLDNHREQELKKVA